MRKQFIAAAVAAFVGFGGSPRGACRRGWVGRPTKEMIKEEIKAYLKAEKEKKDKEDKEKGH